MENEELSLVKSIKFTSRRAVADQLRNHVHTDKCNCGRIIREARALSHKKGLMMAKGFLDNASDSNEDFHSISSELIQYGKSADNDTRRTIVQAISEKNGRISKLYMIHSISSMQKKDARNFMKDYFETGGDIESVMLWMSEAGRVIRNCQTKPDGTAGKAIKKAKEAFEWIGDKLEDAWDSFTQGVKAVMDAIVKAGKTIGECLKKIYNWSKEQIKDIISALIEAGKSVKEIAKEIAKECKSLILESYEKSKTFFAKVIDGIKASAQKVGDFFVGLYHESKEVFQSAINTIKDTISDFKDVLEHIAKEAYSVAKDIVGKIKEAGIAVANVLKRAVECTHETLKTICKAIKDIGVAIGEMFKTAYQWTKSQINKLVSVLIEIGYSVKNFAIEVAKTCRDFLVESYETCKSFLRNTLESIKEIGKSIGEFVVNIYNTAKDLLSVVVDALKNIVWGIKDAIVYVVTQAGSIAKKFIIALKDIGISVVNIIKETLTATYEVIKTTFEVLIATGSTFKDIIVCLFSDPKNIKSQALKALKDLKGSVKSLFNEMYNSLKNSVSEITNNFKAIGATVKDVVLWSIEKGEEIFKSVLSAMVKVGTTTVDVLQSIAEKSMKFIGYAVDFFCSTSQSCLNIIKDAFKCSFEMGKNVYNLIINSASHVAKLVKEVSVSTYNYAKTFVKDLYNLGLKTCEILAIVAKSSYNAFRRVVFGIIKNLGPIGEIMDWVYTQAENVGSKLWEDTIQAIKYANGKIEDVVTWALNKGEDALAAVYNGWETSKNALSKLYKITLEGLQKGVIYSLEKVGEATARLNNDIDYFITFINEDLFPSLSSLVKGLIIGGVTISKIVAETVKLGTKSIVYTISGLIDAGCGLTEIIVEFLKNPKASISKMLSSLKDLSFSLTDVFDAIKNEAYDYKKKIVNSYYNDLKVTAYDIVDGVKNLGYGTVGVVSAILLSNMAYYRKMYKVEIDEAKKVFGNSIDYSKVRLTDKFKSNDLAQSWKRIVNEIIIGLQSMGGEEGRPFTVATTINFDPYSENFVEGKVDSETKKYVGKHFIFYTLIHELTHVWQFLNEGTSYMMDALEDQFIGDGYDIRKAFDKMDESNEEVTSENAKELFHKYFNLEQQAKVIEYAYCKTNRNDDIKEQSFSFDPENKDKEIICFGKLVYA